MMYIRRILLFCLSPFFFLCSFFFFFFILVLFFFYPKKKKKKNHIVLNSLILHIPSFTHTSMRTRGNNTGKTKTHPPIHTYSTSIHHYTHHHTPQNQPRTVLFLLSSSPKSNPCRRSSSLPRRQRHDGILQSIYLLYHPAAPSLIFLLFVGKRKKINNKDDKNNKINTYAHCTALHCTALYYCTFQNTLYIYMYNDSSRYYLTTVVLE